MAQTVAVDFDGVIHAYSKGWQDGSIYDEPMPGAIEALHALMKSYAVFVHTTREPGPVCDWLDDHDIEATFLHPLPEFWNERGVVLVTNRKLPAIAYIDDRAIRFESWKQALADLADKGPGSVPPTGLDKVAEAVRRSRGGDAPPQIRGLA